MNISKVYPKKRKKIIMGVDEVGRGALAGPVYASAVVLLNDSLEDISVTLIKTFKDSKVLSRRKREIIFNKCLKQKVLFGIGYANEPEIDSLNILVASMLAMVRAVFNCIKKIPSQSQKIHVLFDGVYTPNQILGPWSSNLSAEAIKNGDKLIPEISCASIIAKVTRDEIMNQAALKYPGFGFHSNSGYGTKQHLAALRILGVSSIHRKTFNPIKKLLFHSRDQN
mgnify:CR=1 FL=1|tara:strand:- start:7363 stop:8037 length:675 start_codon:yes stop_codon:yes gene_type:complete